MIEIFPGDFIVQNPIVIPTSKSWANRYQLLSLLYPIEIEDLPHSTDVLEMKSAMNQIQAGDKIIYTGNGGTTTRFILGYLSSRVGRWTVHVGDQMAKRPLDSYGQIPGVLFEKTSNHTYVVERLKAIERGLEILLKGQPHSGQFYSSLYMAYSPYKIKWLHDQLESSELYLKMTEKAIEQAQTKSKIKIPLDQSSLAYPLAMKKLGAKIEFAQEIEADPFQADSFLLERQDHWPEEFDVRTAPDLSMTLIVLALFQDKKITRFTHLSILEKKESNRKKEMLTLLSLISAVQTVQALSR